VCARQIAQRIIAVRGHPIAVLVSLAVPSLTFESVRAVVDALQTFLGAPTADTQAAAVTAAVANMTVTA
jgi:thiamine monophosphate kinase